jgi:hypothetical protein
MTGGRTFTDRNFEAPGFAESGMIYHAAIFRAGNWPPPEAGGRDFHSGVLGKSPTPGDPMAGPDDPVPPTTVDIPIED